MAPRWLNKASSAGKWLQKAVGTAGSYLGKAVKTGNQLYNLANSIDGGILTANPIAQGVKSALAIGGALADTATSIGNSHRIQDVQPSVQNLYSTVTKNVPAIVGAGATLATGVPV